MSVNGGDSLSTQNETKAGISRDADYEENKKQRNWRTQGYVTSLTELLHVSCCRSECWCAKPFQCVLSPLALVHHWSQTYTLEDSTTIPQTLLTLSEITAIHQKPSARDRHEPMLAKIALCQCSGATSSCLVISQWSFVTSVADLLAFISRRKGKPQLRQHLNAEWPVNAKIGSLPADEIRKVFKVLACHFLRRRDSAKWN